MCLQQSKETQITTLLIELATHHFLLESTVYRCMLLDHYGDCLQVTCTLWYSTSSIALHARVDLACTAMCIGLGLAALLTCPSPTTPCNQLTNVWARTAWLVRLTQVFSAVWVFNIPGKKWNVLRNRVDSCEYNVDQVVHNLIKYITTWM